MGNIECTGGGDARANRRTKPPLTREDSEFDNEASVADTTEPSASSSTGSWWSNLTGAHIVNAHIVNTYMHCCNAGVVSYRLSHVIQAHGVYCRSLLVR